MHRASNAQALVEFGLVLPLLLVTFVGLVSLGRGLVFAVAVQQGSREAARIGAAAALDTTITDADVLNRLVTASSPALVGCAAVLATQEQCGDGSWMFTLRVTAPGGTSSYSSLAAARSSAPGGIGGWQLDVQARGSLPVLFDFDTGIFGSTLGQIAVQGNAIMVIA